MGRERKSHDRDLWILRIGMSQGNPRTGEWPWNGDVQDRETRDERDEGNQEAGTEAGDLIEIVVSPTEDGFSLSSAGDLSGLGLEGVVQKRRASHILPAVRWKCAAFLFLRWAFAETGRVSDWTRTWRGPWMVDLSPSHGPIAGPFLDRPEALRFERQWLSQEGFLP